MWTMCEFHDSNGNGFGDIWWTDKSFSSRVYIDNAKTEASHIRHCIAARIR